jgi:hypothetical protein
MKELIISLDGATDNNEICQEIKEGDVNIRKPYIKLYFPTIMNDRDD